MTESLTSLTDEHKKWNKSVYDHINSHKRNLIHKLPVVQEQMDISRTNLLASHKMDL